MLNTRKNIHYLVYLIFGVLTFTSCSSDDDYDSKASLLLDKTTIASSQGSQFIEISSNGNWTISISFPEGTGAWCNISGRTEGTGNAFVTLRNYANLDDLERRATIILESGTDRIMVDIVQQAHSSTDPSPTPNETPSGSWLELPEKVTNNDYETVTHYTNISNKEVRNFTVFYDKTEKMAYWVAYPLHRSYIGSSGRTDAWAFDPQLPQWAQPNLLSGFGSGYDRGHQIPSGDRTANRSANSQTFYFTNMTAQNSTLNQGVWANLEGRCRSWMANYDTLYVTTGAILQTKGGNETWDKRKEASIPNYYFKVLLGKKGTNYKSIGFWFQNKSYPNNSEFINYAKSVRQIEELTGFNFFANLPNEIQDEVEGSFKAQDWGI